MLNLMVTPASLKSIQIILNNSNYYYWWESQRERDH
jgi:hypothetical protein